MFDPIKASEDIKKSYIDYITTTFDMADPQYRFLQWYGLWKCLCISSLRIKKQGEVKNFCRSHPAGPRRIGLAQSSGKSTLPTKE